jgi:hypothetical protein
MRAAPLAAAPRLAFVARLGAFDLAAAPAAARPRAAFGGIADS